MFFNLLKDQPEYLGLLGEAKPDIFTVSIAVFVAVSALETCEGSINTT